MVDIMVMEYRKLGCQVDLIDIMSDHFGVPSVEFIGDHPMDHFKHIIKSGKRMV